MKRHVITTSLGDWNLGVADMRRIAERANAVFHHGSGPDGAIVTGAERTTTETLAKFGSDHHHAVLYQPSFEDTVIRLIGWNPWVGQRPADVREGLMQMVTKHRPDVIALQEAYRLRQMLTTIPGYRRHQGLPGGEGTDCALLIRRDHAVVNDGMLRMEESWIGPKHGTRKAPRQYPFDRILIAGKPVTLRVLDVHLPTGGFSGRNAAAVTESADRIVQWHRTVRAKKREEVK